jgi:hypothetical protein
MHLILTKLLPAWARNLMFIGILIMATGVFVEVGMHVAKHPAATAQSEQPSADKAGQGRSTDDRNTLPLREIVDAVGNTAAKLITELGVAFFVLGGVGFLFETEEMKGYFDNRFEESLKADGWKKDFLTRVHQSLEIHEWKRSIFRKILFAELLDKNSHKPSAASLKSMNAIKALSDLEETDAANSEMKIEIQALIDHHKEIIGAIADGYKAHMNIDIKYFADGPDTFRVEDSTAYDVRRGRNNRTPEMIHGAGQGELLSVAKADFERLVDGRWESILDSAEDEANRETSRRSCFLTPLRKDISEKPDIDRVRIYVEYTVRRDALLTWKSKLPVYNYTLKITPPKGYVTKISRFMPQDPKNRDVPSRPQDGPPEEHGPLDETADVQVGDVTVIFPTWNMPYQGVVWSFVKKVDGLAPPLSNQTIEGASA